MHAKTLQIAWHKGQSICSVDILVDSSSPTPLTLATAGQDGAVRLWSIDPSSSSSSPSSSSSSDTHAVEFLSTLHGHLAGVNIVRWAPQGRVLASADNAGSILLWSRSAALAPIPSLLGSAHAPDDEDPNDYKQHWRSTHLLQGHKHEVNDLAWSPCGKFLASVGTDQSLRIWHIPTPESAATAAHVIGSAHDHSDVIQGVAWDPRGQLIATQAVDRSVVVYAIALQSVPGAAGRKVAVLKKIAECKNALASAPPQPDPMSSSSSPPPPLPRTSTSKLYSDPTSTPTSFFRRLAFSPDGALLVTPAGLVYSLPTASESPTHAVHVYARNTLPHAIPSLSLAGHPAPAWCIRFCPTLFSPLPPPANRPHTLTLPYRMLLAVGTDDALVLYDTSRLDCPLAVLKHLHVYRYQDVAWSRDGRVLVAASHDGYCSLVVLPEGEGDLTPLQAAAWPAGLTTAPTAVASENQGFTGEKRDYTQAPQHPSEAAAGPPVVKPLVAKKRIQPTLIAALPGSTSASVAGQTTTMNTS